jgi:hypothetical protein
MASELISVDTAILSAIGTKDSRDYATRLIPGYGYIRYQNVNDQQQM